MDNRKIQSYASKLMSHTKDDNATSPFDEEYIDFDLHVKGDISFMLHTDKYTKIRKELLEKEHWDEKFTEEYIDKALMKFLFRVREENSNRNAPAYFSDLVNEIEGYTQEQIVFVPISGIKLEVESLELGNVKLFTMTDESYDTLVKKIAWVIANPEEITEQQQQIVRTWLSKLKNHVCAEYRCVAESDRARERAIEECQRVFDLLHYSIYILGQTHYNIAVGHLGSVSRYIQTIPVISTDDQRFAVNSRAIGPMTEFSIDQQNIDKMQQFGAFRVAELLKQNLEVDSFGETLLHGLRWFSNAYIQVIRENQFLNLMTCLETFLTRRGMEQITNVVAEGVAFILGTELSERRKLKNRILEFYNYRSRISHEGHSAILNSDLKEFTNIVGAFLGKMIQKLDEFETRKALDEWIENQKFG